MAKISHENYESRKEQYKTTSGGHSFKRVFYPNDAVDTNFFKKFFKSIQALRRKS
jgi:hypothetical protein